MRSLPISLAVALLAGGVAAEPLAPLPRQHPDPPVPVFQLPPEYLSLPQARQTYPHDHSTSCPAAALGRNGLPYFLKYADLAPLMGDCYDLLVSFLTGSTIPGGAIVLSPKAQTLSRGTCALTVNTVRVRAWLGRFDAAEMVYAAIWSQHTNPTNEVGDTWIGAINSYDCKSLNTHNPTETIQWRVHHTDA